MMITPNGGAFMPVPRGAAEGHAKHEGPCADCERMAVLWNQMDGWRQSQLVTRRPRGAYRSSQRTDQMTAKMPKKLMGWLWAIRPSRR